MQWFRFYHEFVDDPKIAMMTDSDQLLWVKALCLASANESRRGVIELSDEEICWKLRITLESWKHAIDKFRAKGMVEHCETGYRIVNWDKRQFKSDSSAERVAKHREAQAKKTPPKKPKKAVTKGSQPCNVTVTPSDTDTDTDSYQSRDIPEAEREDPPLTPPGEMDGGKESASLDEPAQPTPSAAPSQSASTTLDDYPDPVGEQFRQETPNGDMPWVVQYHRFNPTFDQRMVKAVMAWLGKYDVPAEEGDAKGWLKKAFLQGPVGEHRTSQAWTIWEGVLKAEGQKAKHEKRITEGIDYTQLGPEGYRAMIRQKMGWPA